MQRRRGVNILGTNPEVVCRHCERPQDISKEEG